MNYICPKCQHIGDMPFIKVFENNLAAITVKCSECKSKIKYTVKAEVVKKNPIYETVRYFGENAEYANQKVIIGYERLSRAGMSRKKNTRPKKYGRKL